MDGWKIMHFLLGRLGLFSVAFAVSCRDWIFPILFLLALLSIQACWQWAEGVITPFLEGSSHGNVFPRNNAPSHPKKKGVLANYIDPCIQSMLNHR